MYPLSIPVGFALPQHVAMLLPFGTPCLSFGPTAPPPPPPNACLENKSINLIIALLRSVFKSRSVHKAVSARRLQRFLIRSLASCLKRPKSHANVPTLHKGFYLHKIPPSCPFSAVRPCPSRAGDLETGNLTVTTVGSACYNARASKCSVTCILCHFVHAFMRFRGKTPIHVTRHWENLGLAGLIGATRKICSKCAESTSLFNNGFLRL